MEFDGAHLLVFAFETTESEAFYGRTGGRDEAGRTFDTRVHGRKGEVMT